MSDWQKKLPYYAASIVCFAAVALALPALAVWLGLQIEGDAVDYRVPVVRWIVAHHSIPDWPWAMVDDTPLLGEIGMAFFYAFSPNLMRLVPIAGYVSCAWFAGRIFVSLAGEEDPGERRLAALTAAAWIFGLRPLALQANTLLVDTLAAGFMLGAVAFHLRKSPGWSGFFAALALATRYTMWANVAILGAMEIWRCARDRRAFKCIPYFLVSALGALPWMIRNWLVNHNPLFPFATKFFNGFVLDDRYYAMYGRGKGIVDLLLLPYDILYTNSFVLGIFDYTIGKFFYAQLAVLAALALWKPRRFLGVMKELARKPAAVALIVFASASTLAWFLSSQQLRFLDPALAIVNLFMLFLAYRMLPRPGLAALTLLGLFSVYSIEKDSILLALGKQESVFAPAVKKARSCFEKAGVRESDLVGHYSRDGVLGFFGHRFVYGGTNGYYLIGRPAPLPDFIYDPEPEFRAPVGYEPWPRNTPCLWKKNES